MSECINRIQGGSLPGRVPAKENPDKGAEKKGQQDGVCGNQDGPAQGALHHIGYQKAQPNSDNCPDNT